MCSQSDPQAINFFRVIEAYKNELFEQLLEQDPDRVVVDDDDDEGTFGYSAETPLNPITPTPVTTTSTTLAASATDLNT